MKELEIALVPGKSKPSWIGATESPDHEAAEGEGEDMQASLLAADDLQDALSRNDSAGIVAAIRRICGVE